MSLRIGMRLPSFSVEGYVPASGRPVRITPLALRGRWSVLFYYPRNFSAAAEADLAQIARRQPGLELGGVAVLAASCASIGSHRAWFTASVRLREIRFPVLADDTRRVAAQLGILDESGVPLNASVIADPDGIVRYVQLADPDVPRETGEVLRALAALRAAAPVQPAARPAVFRPSGPTRPQLVA